MIKIRSLLASSSGTTAAEFAMVLPLLLLLLGGTIDAARYMWALNTAEKASQMGVRYAVVTDPIANGLITYDFAGTSGLAAGDTVPASAYSKMTCSKPTGSSAETCTCAAGGSCPWGTGVTTGAFGNLQAYMVRFMPQLAANNIVVTYLPSGIGYAGDPNGPDIDPVVTVTVTGAKFQSLVSQLFGGLITLPDISSSLTMEDASGSTSN